MKNSSQREVLQLYDAYIYVGLFGLPELKVRWDFKFNPKEEASNSV